VPIRPRPAPDSAASGRWAVSDIYSEDEVPEDQQHFLELNKELSRDWPVITEMKDPPEDADEWRDVKEKFRYLER
jgi:ferredoxin